MQVGLATTTSSSAAALSRGSIDAPQSVKSRKVDETPAARNPFPEAALLSTRPLRYNVQLNQQLTAVQQADSYLSSTETQLLQLRHAAGQGKAQEQAAGLDRLLNRRAQLSGGTVDRQFNVRLQSQSQVNFTLPGSEKVLSSPGGETLVFMLGGAKRELAAVALPEEGSPRKVLTHLNVGLGRMGIHASQDKNGQLNFSVDESRWERVSQQLSVRGEGHNFPADSFTVLAARPEMAQQEGLEQLVARPDGGRESQLKLQQALEQITGQRGKLRMQQERVRSRIDEMATPYSPQQAQETARALGEVLGNSGSGFSSLNRALSAQANVQQATVKNLLG
ncbi:Uncharacterised protein [Cedecea davisae]|uniref:Flagellar hook-associated protein n=1 Tax=Cedecea davisae DSM 4568 TaxID=566551 RepID=S3J3F3_9ENTR|nr:hypothetical protein [Cedecea davisae]EPF19241.1 hypothetical protein HMPREF0201_00971 [Cedecea davisae DSM 4568]SUX28968.1 Uncharacterised protein [Cedecea davisae]